jgi:hypothetical protein
MGGAGKQGELGQIAQASGTGPDGNRDDGTGTAVDEAPDRRIRLLIAPSKSPPDGMSDSATPSTGALMGSLDSINPSLTRYRRVDPAPVLPLRDEPDLLSWLESTGRLVADEDTASTDVSTVEEEELSALMGEKEDYNQADEQAEEDWED